MATEVIVFEHATFKELQTMYLDLIQRVDQLSNENFILKNRYLTTEDVAQLTGYDTRTITLKKDEIGYISQGHKIKFKQSDVVEWMERYYVKARGTSAPKPLPNRKNPAYMKQLKRDLLSKELDTWERKQQERGKEL